MSKIYKTEFNKECCRLATERCQDIQIEGFPLYSGMQNCLRVYCRKCWNKISSDVKSTNPADEYRTNHATLSQEELDNLNSTKEENFVLFKGKKFVAPFKCLCCGKEIDVKQFCYGRTCGYCDMGRCQPKLFKYEKGHGRKDIFEQAKDVPQDKNETGDKNGK